MSRLYTGRWKPDTVTMVFVDNGLCPYVELAGKHLEHLCDLLTFLTGKKFIYGGIVAEQGEYHGTIYHKFVPPTTENNFWAWAYRKMDLPYTDVIGGLCQYRQNKVVRPEHFAGICLHEVKHVLRVKHFNDFNSIMNNDPYHGHPYQANPMAADYDTFRMLFGSEVPLWPCAFDYGDISLNKCVIHIPSIQWAEGSYAAIWLHGKQEGGKWILEAESYDIQQQGYVGRPVASLSNDVLSIPLRYQGSTVEVVAPLKTFSGPSSKVTFEVSEIKPLHIHSARDWVH